MRDDFDLVVLGGGSGGYAAALRAAELGLRVALVEKDRLGGTCLHKGCIPTKAMLQSAEVADSVRGASAFGVAASFTHIDIPAVYAYRDGVVQGLFRGLTGLVASRGIEVVAGVGALTSPTTVTVTMNADGAQRALTGRHVLMATGSIAKAVRGTSGWRHDRHE